MHTHALALHSRGGEHGGLSLRGRGRYSVGEGASGQGPLLTRHQHWGDTGWGASSPGATQQVSHPPQAAVPVSEDQCGRATLMPPTCSHPPARCPHHCTPHSQGHAQPLLSSPFSQGKAKFRGQWGPIIAHGVRIWGKQPVLSFEAALSPRCFRGGPEGWQVALPGGAQGQGRGLRPSKSGNKEGPSPETAPR